jgi:hypothetical protein
MKTSIQSLITELACKWLGHVILTGFCLGLILLALSALIHCSKSSPSPVVPSHQQTSDTPAQTP